MFQRLRKFLDNPDWKVYTLYDKIIKTINLTNDEIAILKELLSYRLDQCVSIGEEIVVKDLLDKLED